MKLSFFIFFIAILSSTEARRISRYCPVPLAPTNTTAPTTTTTNTTTSAPTTPTTTTPTTNTALKCPLTPTTTASTPATTTTTTTTSTPTPTTTTTTTPTTTTTAPSTATTTISTGTVASVSETGVPGLGPNGNPAGMDLTNFVENLDIPQHVIKCSSPRFTYSNGIWTFAQMADAFYEYAVKPWNFPNPTDRSQHIDECVAAMVIIAGECSTPVGQVGCSTHSGPSGVYQTDFLRTIPGFPSEDIMNLCLSSFGAGYMAAPYLAAPGKSCTVSVNGGTPASIFTCYDAPKTVNEYGADCADPQSKAGVTYENFIGPFCHKAWSSRWSACAGRGPGCCALFNGGGNSYQVAWPEYYWKMAATQGGADYLNICTEAAKLGPVVD